MDRPAPDWLSVSRETLDKLIRFEGEVVRWNAAINLVSRASQPDIWQRHILDSAQIYPLIAQKAGLWLDIGSGGGFPGLVMAIMGAQNVVLVESDQRKATFLREMGRQLNLPITVLARRIEDLPPQNANTITARALTALTGLLAYANTHLAAGGQAVFLKGRQLPAELDQAHADWHFDHQTWPSKTETDAAIIAVQNIKKR